MTDIINSIYSIIIDKTKSFGYKTALFISIVGVACIIDYSFNISYNSYITNKLNNLESINRLKSVYKTDSTRLQELNIIEKKIIEKKHYSDFFSLDLISLNLSKIDFSSNTKDQKNTQIKRVEIIKKNIIRSKFWMVLSSSFTFLLIFPFVLLLPLYNKEMREKQNIIGWFALLIINVGIILLITWIAYLIPLIFGNPIWNYILNMLIHISFLTLIIIIGKKTT